MIKTIFIFDNKPQQVAEEEHKLQKWYYPDWSLKMWEGKAVYYLH
jgi:hypothetical protein